MIRLHRIFLATTAAVRFDLALSTVQGFAGGSVRAAGVENLTTGAGNDVLLGTAGGNVLNGGAGADSLWGLAGADRLVGGNYPYIGELAEQFAVKSIEFLRNDHPVYALRPASPLQVIAGSSFYSPRDSFVYPGGEEDMGPAEG